MTLLLDKQQVTIIKEIRPDMIESQNKAGMFIKCTLKKGTTTYDIYMLGQQVQSIIQQMKKY
jgi:hypothetical protein